MIIFSDTHIGCNRQGGTTPQSALALKNYLREQLRNLFSTGADHYVCNGDFFDKFDVETSELIGAYEIISEYLSNGGKFTAIMGNHDASARGNKVSSFHLLSHFLKVKFPNTFRMIDHTDGFCQVEGDVWVISHQMNQDLFEIEVEKACKETQGKWLMLHCNVKNTFAEHSDQSLNLTDALLAKLMPTGWRLIVAHEHQGYELRVGKIKVVGNQFPSSISDCIGDPEKFALKIDGMDFEYIKTWDAKDDYVENDWRELDGNNDRRFVRVVGQATTDEAADVIAAISKFRQKSSAFIVSNAVAVDGVVAIEELAEASIASIKSFDVVAAIMEQLDEKEQITVKGLLNACET